MAEALVSALMQTVIGNLNKALLPGVGLLWGLEDDLRRLESVFSTIQLVLQDAEVKQRSNFVLQNWLLKLKDVAYDAEHVLDLIATKDLRRRFNSERGKHGHLTSFFSKRNPSLFRLQIAGKVKDVRGRLDDLVDERRNFHLEKGAMNNQVGVVESRQTGSLVNESEIFGRDEEREMLVQKLLHDMADRDDLSVCAVWGMGGIGKTTIAQLVYNDGRVEKHFELRIWVCVSEDFSLQRLVKAILESVQGGGCSLTELDPLLRLLQDKLRGKKFLLVLDDVWNEDQSLWDPLKEALRCGLKGSGVMVTTRNENIARMMATDETILSHRIGYLSEADSWSLFKRRAFACRTEDENLVGIGEEIVKKCGGVPLAIKALGSLMRSKSHENEWLAVKESKTWNQPGHGNDIFPVLMLSYDNLSPQMRQCFSYCCVFPKDSWMDKDRLIQLWMANGFLQEECQKDLYLIGQLIFKELVWRSFLQDVEKHKTGKMRCKMHDLMHDLAESVMRQEIYNLVDDHYGQKIPPRVRHLSCKYQSLEMIEEKRDKRQLLNVDTLHSLIHLNDSISFEFRKSSFSFLSNQQRLRVLDMRFRRTKEIPKFVDKLEHLRFLSMSCSELTKLPESMTRLHNLQTLKLTDTHGLRKLPEGLKCMKNLWVVEIEDHGSLVCTPPGIGELTSLQRLSVFIVGEDSAHQISQLKKFNLGGKLSIRGLENVRDVKAANMIMKRNLESLNLSWTSGANKISMEHFEATLEGIQPHHNLEKICISSYQGSRFPSWMSSPAFTNLSKITLESCEKCEHLPPFGRLPALKVLKLVGLDSIRRLGGEWCGDGKSSFVALTKLSIRGMHNLEEWIIPNSHESFLSLQYLYLERCPKLIRLPFLSALKNLVIKKTNPAVLGSMVATSIESLCLSDDADELSLLPGGLLSAQKNIKELQINDCDNLRSLSIMSGDLYSLKKLHFSWCTKLEYPLEGLKFLNSLEYLRFYGCDSLRTFPAAILENMPCLRSLAFVCCGKLDPLSGPPLQRVLATSRLHELEIIHCPELKCLPESIQQLSASLRTLTIMNCSGLCSLPEWIENLQSLSTFSLWGCGNLTSLPDGFGNLKSLSVLDISNCSPILAKRCEKSKGEDWPKISHIPKIYIRVGVTM